MCQMKTCCCCCNIKTGSIFSITLTLLLAILTLITAGYKLYQIEQRNNAYVDDNFLESFNSIVNEAVNEIAKDTDQPELNEQNMLIGEEDSKHSEGMALPLEMYNFNGNNGYDNRLTTITGIAISGLWVLSCIIAYIGICCGSRGCLIPWMVMTGLVIAGFLLTIVVLLMNSSLVFANLLLTILFILEVFFFLLHIYAMICVIALFRAHLNTEYDGAPMSV